MGINTTNGAPNTPSEEPYNKPNNNQQKHTLKKYLRTAELRSAAIWPAESAPDWSAKKKTKNLWEETFKQNCTE